MVAITTFDEPSVATSDDYSDAAVRERNTEPWRGDTPPAPHSRYMQLVDGLGPNKPPEIRQ